MSALAIFESEKGDIQVQLSGDTVWLRRDKITLLFGRDRTVIGRHISNIFKEGELVKDSVLSDRIMVLRKGYYCAGLVTYCF